MSYAHLGPRCPHEPPDDDGPRCPDCGEELERAPGYTSSDWYWECPGCGWEHAA